MTVWIVCRHEASKEWIVDNLPSNGGNVRTIKHLNLDEVIDGDWVAGTLPVHMAGRVCARGARYFHLTLDLEYEQRGKELTSEDLSKANARLEEYVVSSPGGNT
jgi:CRISPR-associated protein Csx16